MKGSPSKGGVALTRDPKEPPSPFQHVRRKRGLSSGTEPLILDFQPPGALRNKFLGITHSLVCGILLQQPEWIKIHMDWEEIHATQKSNKRLLFTIHSKNPCKSISKQ